jgi:hypothetical protein
MLQVQKQKTPQAAGFQILQRLTELIQQQYLRIYG